jgi:hypothetical protein
LIQTATCSNSRAGPGSCATKISAVTAHATVYSASASRAVRQAAGAIVEPETSGIRIDPGALSAAADDIPGSRVADALTAVSA